MCYILLDLIRKHYVLLSNKKNVLDDWEYVDDFDEFDDDDSPQSYISRSHIGCFEKSSSDVNRVSFEDGPVIIEIVFRDARQDELSSRCMGIAVHWTRAGGRGRLSTPLSELSDFRDGLSSSGLFRTSPSLYILQGHTRTFLYSFCRKFKTVIFLIVLFR